MSISSLQARAQQLLQKFFSTPSPSGPIIDAWHVFSLVRAMWRWMVRPLLWVLFSSLQIYVVAHKGTRATKRYFIDEFNEFHRQQVSILHQNRRP
ncbi:hypothetical protein WJ973_25395 [Achromobacter xylosoxidans]